MRLSSPLAESLAILLLNDGDMSFESYIAIVSA